MSNDLHTLKEADISTKLLTGQILPRRMQWYLINEGELEEFEKMNSESSQFLTVGIAAMATAIGLFGSSFTITTTFTLTQMVIFLLHASGVRAWGHLSNYKRSTRQK